ncbi:MAG: MotA/TolQ/ExbB proton channel family protein [Pseudomonadota bacterium]|nr:MotA/TolQ/ExbB proton channel family protein [Pseudomonadota bacterium]
MIERLAFLVYDLWSGGGVVMPGLFATAFVLWFAMGERLFLLRRGDARPVRVLVDAALAGASRTGRPVAERGVIDTAVVRGARLWREQGGPVPLPLLDEALGELELRLNFGTRLVTCLVAMAPLLGLLGTVTGLIGTFGSLGTSSTSAASEGIAGGIVEALYATQMGLAIAVPGLLMSGFLRQRQTRLAGELEELKAVLGGARQAPAQATR